MGKLKTTKKSKSSSRSSTIGRVATSAIGALVSGGSSKKGGGGRRRHRGPTYWANKVLVEKLKKKYNRLKYGGAR